MLPLSVNGLDMGDGSFLQTGRLNIFTGAVIPEPIQLLPSLFGSFLMNRSNSPQGRCGYRQQYSGPSQLGWSGFLFRIRASDNFILQSYGGKASSNGIGGFIVRRWVTPFRFFGGSWHYEIGMEAGGLAVGAIAQYPPQGCPVGLEYGDGDSDSTNAFRGCVRPIGDSPQITWGFMGVNQQEWTRPWPAAGLVASVT